MSNFNYTHNNKHTGTDHSISVTRRETSGVFRVYYQKVEYPETPRTIDRNYVGRNFYYDTLLIQKRIIGSVLFEVHTLFQYPDHKGKEIYFCCHSCERDSFMNEWNSFESSYSMEQEAPSFYELCIPNKLSVGVSQPHTQPICPTLSKKELDHMESLYKKKEPEPVIKKEPVMKQSTTKKKQKKKKKHKKDMSNIQFTENFNYEEIQSKKKKQKLHWKPCELRFDIDGYCYSSLEFKEEHGKNWFDQWNESPIAFSCEDNTYKQSHCYFSEDLEDDDYEFIISSLKTYRNYIKSLTKSVESNQPSIIVIE